jgi:cyclomaltodextrinase / maltogenic alpha-amylase / neopullulanase
MSLRSRTSRALCAFAIFAFATSANAADHTFEIDTSSFTPQPRTMSLAGDFNGWSTTATPMKLAAGHKWSVTIKDVEEGTRYYKFVVDAGTPGQKWINDPKADKSLEVSDGNSGNNSGVVIGVDPVKLPPAKANHINQEALRFDSTDPADLDLSPAGMRIRVRTQANDVQHVIVSYRATKPNPELIVDGDVAGGGSKLRKVATERGLDVYASVIPWKVDDPSSLTIQSIGILVDDGDNAAATLEMKKGQNARVVASESTPPRWTADANWYQIFVERFRNADPSNDPGDFTAYERLIAWNADWFKTQPGEVPGDENFFHGAGNVWKRRYGGDLAGVREKLPYLRSLGINAIYFNPIFEAESMHKYDTADYRHVDDNFGVRDADQQRGASAPLVAEPQAPNHERGAHATMRLGNRELFNLDGSPVAADFKETEDPTTWRWTKSDLLFLELLKDAHAQGFHLIVDGVFNHTGRAHPYFQDVLKNGKRSKYADWFEITDFGDEKNWHEMADPYAVHGKPGGVQWNAWDGKNGHLPNFKEDAKLGLAQGPRDHILAIAKRWGDPDGDPKTNDGIDGWRLDAANEVPHAFWVDFRAAVRAANPESYITGELWGPSQAWVNSGKEFDAVMNYQFAMSVVEFFCNNVKLMKVSDFNNRMVKVWFMYPQASAMAMQNLFDSHDTDRLASMFVNADRPYDGENRPQDNAQGKKYDMRAPTAEEWQRLLQAVAFQNTFIGAPMTYYGDEAGMWGADDPSDRQPFVWDDKGPYAPGVGFNKNVFDGFQRFIAIRNALPALRAGSFYPVAIDDAANTYAFGRELGDKHVYVAMNRSGQPRTIQLDSIENGSYVDFADPKSVSIAMPDSPSIDERPKPVVASDAKAMMATGGKLSIRLPAYGTAILAPR